jgi:hypothetical protein
MKNVIIASTIAAVAGIASANPFLMEAATAVGIDTSNSTRGSIDVLSVDYTGVQTNAAFGNPANEVFNYNIGANSQVVGVSWDINIETIGGSYLSEARFRVTDSAMTTGVSISAGFGVDNPGNQTFSSGGFLSLTDLALDFAVGADGILRVEFWESFVDNAGTGDAIITGNVSFQYIPTPGSFAVLGLGGLVAARRRR